MVSFVLVQRRIRCRFADPLFFVELHWSEDQQMYCDLGVDEVGMWEVHVFANRTPTYTSLTEESMHVCNQVGPGEVYTIDSSAGSNVHCVASIRATFPYSRSCLAFWNQIRLIWVLFSRPSEIQRSCGQTSDCGVSVVITHYTARARTTGEAQSGSR